MFTVEFTKYHGQAAQSLPEKHVCLDVPDVVWSNYINYKNDLLRWMSFLLLRSLWSSNLFIIQLLRKPPYPPPFVKLRSRNPCGQRISSQQMAYFFEAFVEMLRCWSLQISFGEKQKRRKEHQFPAYKLVIYLVFSHPIWKNMRKSNWESFLRVGRGEKNELKPPPRPLKFAWPWHIC